MLVYMRVHGKWSFFKILSVIPWFRGRSLKFSRARRTLNYSLGKSFFLPIFWSVFHIFRNNLLLKQKKNSNYFVEGFLVSILPFLYVSMLSLVYEVLSFNESLAKTLYHHCTTNGFIDAQTLSFQQTCIKPPRWKEIPCIFAKKNNKDLCNLNMKYSFTELKCNVFQVD